MSSGGGSTVPPPPNSGGGGGSSIGIGEGLSTNSLSLSAAVAWTDDDDDDDNNETTTDAAFIIEDDVLETSGTTDRSLQQLCNNKNNNKTSDTSGGTALTADPTTNTNDEEEDYEIVFRRARVESSDGMLDVLLNNNNNKAIPQEAPPPPPAIPQTSSREHSVTFAMDEPPPPPPPPPRPTMSAESRALQMIQDHQQQQRRRRLERSAEESDEDEFDGQSFHSETTTTSSPESFNEERLQRAKSLFTFENIVAASKSFHFSTTTSSTHSRNGDGNAADAAPPADNGIQKRARVFVGKGFKRMSVCWRSFRKDWKRTYQLLFSVFIPMLVLIALSFLFGFFLSRLESPAEFDHNDSVLREAFKFETARKLYANITVNLPKVCILAFKRNLDVDDLVHQIRSTSEILLDPERKLSSASTASIMAQVMVLANELTAVNVTKRLHREEDYAVDLVEFINTCTIRLVPAVERMFQVTSELSAYDRDHAQVTLSWSRCYMNKAAEYETDDESSSEATATTSSDSVMSALLEPPPLFEPESLETYDPSFQVEHYKHVFFRNLDEIAKKNLKEYARSNGLTFSSSSSNGDDQVVIDGTNPGHVVAWLISYSTAAEQATGRTGCAENVPAGAWFWFAVMTTIGYGNATTRSVGGRAMVFTLGFACILLFAAVTARAGNIVSKMFDQDSEHLFRHMKWNLKWIRAPACGLTLRAVLYSLWVLVIAQHYTQWQHSRVGNTDIGLNDGYWFGYISTTTVGLGDYPLQPEVISYIDLFTFPMSFLIGFVFLATFLDKLSEVVKFVAVGTAEVAASSARRASLMFHMSAAAFAEKAKHTLSGRFTYVHEPSDSDFNYNHSHHSIRRYEDIFDAANTGAAVEDMEQDDTTSYYGHDSGQLSIGTQIALRLPSPNRSRELDMMNNVSGHNRSSDSLGLAMGGLPPTPAEQASSSRHSKIMLLSSARSCRVLQMLQEEEEQLAAGNGSLARRKRPSTASYP